MASTYAAVSTRMWSAELRRCSTKARYLRAYIATCPGRATEGLFPFSLGYAQADTDLTEEDLREALAELQQAGIIEWDPQRELVLDLEALEVANITSEPNKRIRGALVQLRGLGNTPLMESFLRLAEAKSPALAKAIRGRIVETAGSKEPTTISF